MPNLTELFTGAPRPRHIRFSSALEHMCVNSKYCLQKNFATKASRIAMSFNLSKCGFRDIKLPAKNKHCYILHQAISTSNVPYIAEFDIPFAIYGYNLKRYNKFHFIVKKTLERDNLKKIIVFSYWAKKLFDFSFGPKVGSKCTVLYPLANNNYQDKHIEESIIECCEFDFCFISTQFRIKAGVELIRAFSKLYSQTNGSIKFCVVTNLDEAKKLLGDLNKIKGITWVPATLNELQIFKLLNRSKCLLHPSLSDSFGVIVLEAMAAGCAIITTNIASFPEMVVDQKNGFVLEAPISPTAGNFYILEYGNAAYYAKHLKLLNFHVLEQELFSAMGKIISDPKLCLKMRRNSFNIFQEKFSINIWQQNMKNILLDVFGVDTGGS